MKAFVLSRYGYAALGDVPLREPGPLDVVVTRVHAAGLNPVDYKTRDGVLRIIRNYPPHHSQAFSSHPVLGSVELTRRLSSRDGLGGQIA